VAAPKQIRKCGTTPMTIMNHSARSLMPNKRRVLITDCIQSREDFFHALDKARRPVDVPSPKNLDALADFLVDAGINRITCANWAMNDKDARAIITVLSEIGVTLYR